MATLPQPRLKIKRRAGWQSVGLVGTPRSAALAISLKFKPTRCRWAWRPPARRTQKLTLKPSVTPRPGSGAMALRNYVLACASALVRLVPRRKGSQRVRPALRSYPRLASSSVWPSVRVSVAVMRSFNG